MTPDRTEKPALRYKGRRFFIWGIVRRGNPLFCRRNPTGQQTRTPLSRAENDPIQNRKTGASIQGRRFFIWGYRAAGESLFCRSRKNTTGQQSRAPPSRTGNDPRQNRKTGVPVQGCRFFFMMDSQRRASQKQDCSAWVMPSLRCRERDFSLSVKICAKGILPWLKCRSIMKLSRS